MNQSKEIIHKALLKFNDLVNSIYNQWGVFIIVNHIRICNTIPKSDSATEHWN